MNTQFKLTFLSVFSILVVVFLPKVNAQWNNNTYENLEISSLITADMESVPTTDGKTWIAFYHQNGGNYDMRAQLIDADGNKLLGSDGVLVSNQTSGSATYVFNVCVDASNNLIIGMQDQRSGTMQAVLYKISQTGTHLWSSSGIILGNGLAPYPAVLTTGETVVAWIDGNSNTLSIQKVTTGGALAWTTPVSVTVSSTNTTRGQIVANLSGKFTMIFQKMGSGISTTLYAQMFNSSGTALYSPLQICNQTTSAARYYSVAAEGDTAYCGYYSSSGFRFNSYFQRINPDGTIPFGMNGSNFNTSTGSNDNYQMETRINMAPGSLYAWSVCSFCDPNQTNYGVYIQKFRKTTGARQFTDQGKVVYAISSVRDMQAGNLALVNDNPMFMSYDNTYKIYATRLDATGNFAWPVNRVEISSTTASAGNPKGRYGFTPIGPNRCAGVWTEDRGGGDLGYAQGISVGGLIGIDVATQGGVPATITTPGGTLQMVATVYPASANQSVTWSIVQGTGQAVISTGGLVTALVDGTVWAKATAVQDVTMKDSMLITMTNQVPVAPDVVTLPATDITLSTALLNGTVDANFFSSTVSFEWGLTNSYGNTVAATPAQVTGNTVTPVSATLPGLDPGTTYHFRCKATNAGGTAYGADQNFTTLCLLAGTISSITGTDAVCAGATGITYSVDPFPGATAYVWTLPSGATVSAGANTNVITVDFATNAISGDVIVYATDGTCNSLPAEAFYVTVTQLPADPGTISGVQVVCEGNSAVQYSVSPVAYATGYEWAVPAGAVITSGQNTNAIVVNFLTGTVSGNISVYGTNYCGSGNTGYLPVSVEPQPAMPGDITGPDHICAEADDIQYSVPPVTNAYGYVWTLPQGVTITAGANTYQITVHFAPDAQSGDITVYGTNGNCQGLVSSPLYVEVAPIPETPVVTYTYNTLTSSVDEGNQWYVDGSLIPGATGKEYTPVISGYYTVIVTLNGCSSQISNSILVNLVSVGENLAGATMTIYPNPNGGQFNIRMFAAQRTIYTLEIYNSLGSLVMKQESLPVDGNVTIPVSINGMQPGVYMAVLRSGGNCLTAKVNVAK
jgi:hypothetical protein